MAERLLLGPPWRARLLQWARCAAPREACGLLLGRRLPAEAASAVTRALWSPNLAREHDRYELDPAAHLVGERLARAGGLEVLGVWHSHPRGTPRPSARDRALAQAGWWYVIVGLAPEPALAAFRAVPGALEPGALEPGAPERPAP